MGNIFLIASQRGCGTRSVSKYLNGLGGQTLCCHEAYYEPVPQDPVDDTEMPMPERLMLYARRSGQVCGAVGGVYGAIYRNEILAQGGRSAVIFRHPVDRAISVCRHSMERELWALFENAPEPSIVVMKLKSLFQSERLRVCHQILTKLCMEHGAASYLDSLRRLPKNPCIAEVKELLTTNFVTRLKQARFIFHLLNSVSWDFRNFRDFPISEHLMFEQTIAAGRFEVVAKAVLPSTIANGLGSNDFEANKIHENNRSGDLPNDTVYRELEGEFPLISPALCLIRDLVSPNIGDLGEFYRKLGYDLPI